MTGPPVSAAFGADGTLTPAGAGFVKKQGATEDQIERVKTPKGEYIGVRKHQRGKAAVDVLPDVLTGVLRGMSFPKQMRWDALLDDGKGELPFGRPIRWILYLYGGRVVPFTIGRSPLGAGLARAGDQLRREHLRPSLPDDERPRRPRRQGQELRRLPQAARPSTS